MWPPPAGATPHYEFSMDSEINRRMMQSTNPHGTDKTKNPKVPAVACEQGRGTRYMGCLPRRKGDPFKPCNTVWLRNRECQP